MVSRESLRVYLVVVDEQKEVYPALDALSVPYDKCLRFKDKMPYGGVNRESWCRITSGLESDASLEEHLASLVQKLAPFKDKLKSLAGMFYVQCTIVLETRAANPGLHLPATSVSFLAEIGACVDIDIYCFDEESVASQEWTAN